MPVVAAYPLIAAGVSAAYGAYQTHKQNQAAKAAQASGQPLMNAQTALAKQAAEQGQQLYNFGMPQLNKAAGYYGSLLTGGKSAVAGAIAPDVANLSDVYRGAERSLERNAPGPGRDVAMADLLRQRAGQIGGLALNVRPQAAAQVANLGQVGVSGGQSGTTGAAGIYSSLLSHQLDQQRFGLESRKYSDEQWGQFGSSLSKIIGDFLQAYQDRQGGKGNLPSRPYIYATWMNNQ